MPRLAGRRIELRFAPALRAHRGRLFSGGARGKEVHAGSFLRRREVVLASELLHHPSELVRILVHEVFHFVWLRVGNPLRRSWEAQLMQEHERRARGELGWSAEHRKRDLTSADRAQGTRKWREYACESFCDSAAWLLGAARRHDEFTLARRFREQRRQWFRQLLDRSVLKV